MYGDFVVGYKRLCFWVEGLMVVVFWNWMLVFGIVGVDIDRKLFKGIRNFSMVRNRVFLWRWINILSEGWGLLRLRLGLCLGLWLLWLCWLLNGWDRSVVYWFGYWGGIRGLVGWLRW